MCDKNVNNFIFPFHNNGHPFSFRTQYPRRKENPQAVAQIQLQLGCTIRALKTPAIKKIRTQSKPLKIKKFFLKIMVKLYRNSWQKSTLHCNYSDKLFEIHRVFVPTNGTDHFYRHTAGVNRCPIYRAKPTCKSRKNFFNCHPINHWIIRTAVSVQQFIKS